MLSPVRALSLFLTLLAAASTVPAADDEEQPEIDIGYHALKPAIVSNLNGGPKYIRCDVQLKTEQASELSTIELHTPALRHAILMLIAGEDGNRLATRKGKEDLREKALAAVQRQLEELAGEKLVSDLYFTSYYVK